MIIRHPLLIVPAYNEEATITEVVQGICSEGYDYVVINDGSTDSTLAICHENNFNVIDLPVNLGLAGAFQTGMLYACRNGYDCAVQFDADKQHRPEYIGDLVAALDRCDIAIGSRFVTAKKPRTARMIGSSLISIAIKLTTGRTIKDPTSGMRCFNRRMMELLASNINMGPEPDTLAHLIRSAQARVKEVQVRVDERSAGKSYLNIKISIAYMVRILFSVLFIQFFRGTPRRSMKESAPIFSSPRTIKPSNPSFDSRINEKEGYVTSATKGKTQTEARVDALLDDELARKRSL